jgi:ergothioneine biosynthesis protein EgtB
MPKSVESEESPASLAGSKPSVSATWLGVRYRSVRQMSERLAEPLSPEDCQIQSMADASPVKWHLAHTSWFFETFVLVPNAPGYRPFHPSFSFLYNSYYNAIGDRVARPIRGLMTRPTLAEVYAYRAAVDRAMEAYLQATGEALPPSVAEVIELGLNHEQQHQELILTDIKYALALNPLRPAYREGVAICAEVAVVPLDWVDFPGGLQWVGHDGSGFCFDNEGPRHRVYLEGFRLGSRLVTNGEYRTFMEDGGYSRPELWLSDGWAVVRERRWEAPLYWEKRDEKWAVMTLGGLRPLTDGEPVAHVSFYEADAYARWAGARLPSEAEWEVVAVDQPLSGNLLEEGRFHPRPAVVGPGLTQCFGDLWEWTRSPYVPYPGSRPADGALGEYNAKFMCNQLVLRGGSCATPASHIRASYRNFFPPDARWQFSGIRLANDL